MRHTPPKPVCSHVGKTKLPKHHCDNCGSHMVLKQVKAYSSYCGNTGKPVVAVKLVCARLMRSKLRQMFNGLLPPFYGCTETFAYTELHAEDLTQVEVA
jgi:hypothetical protein